ncbi:hypothetical protein IGI42_001447 [Enterococcus sp. AZ109]
MLLMIVGQCIFPSNASAAEMQTVYLHKQVTKGEITTEAATEVNQNMLTEKQGVNGVEFTVIDITQYVRNHSSFNDALEEAKSLTKADIAGLNLGGLVPDYAGMMVAAKGTTQRMAVPDAQGQTTDMDGVLKLSLAKRTANYDASYLVIETNSIESARASDNLIFHFPTENEEEVIHVYSKNDTTLELPSIEKTLAEDHQDFAYEESINYEVKVKVPTLISMYQSFQVVDVPDPALTVDLDSLQVTAEGTTVASSWYQIESKDNGFVLNFIPSRLAPLNGKELKITYRLKLLEGALPDTPFYNKVYLRYHNSIQDGELESTSREILTGGYRFIKVDASNQDQPLKDASFVIKNEDDEYLTTDYAWKQTDTPNDQELFRITSNQEGTFEIKGLAYGTYYLEEVVAPSGYRLLNESVSFKVEKNTYLAGEQPAPMLEVLNSKLPNTGTPTPGTPKTNVVKTTPTSKVSRTLPTTGEQVSIKGVIAGSLIVLFVLILVWFRRNRQQKNT